MELKIPDPSLVLLVGISGSGKSTFAARHFAPSEVLSSDRCRGWVADDEGDMSATASAFAVLRLIAGERLARRRLTVVDATNVQPEARRSLLEIARKHDLLPVAIVLDLAESLCRARNAARPDRSFGRHVLHGQRRDLDRSLGHLRDEGFRSVHLLRSADEVAAATVLRQPLWCDRRGEMGPFDLIGDVHGCGEELDELLAALGYRTVDGVPRHPQGRKVVFLGDLVDRGPKVVEVLRTVMAMVAAGSALAVPGNHDMKLLRKLRGQQVRVAHGLQESLDQIAALGAAAPAFERAATEFLDGLVSHYLLDAGRLVVAHAGMKEEYQGRSSGRVRNFALYGETTGETDELGLPVRANWAAEYRGQANVVYGHTPVPEPQWLNRTLNVDTGCVFGGRLTALRHPERELVSVPARATYVLSVRPLASVVPSPPPPASDLLDLDDGMDGR